MAGWRASRLRTPHKGHGIGDAAAMPDVADAPDPRSMPMTAIGLDAGNASGSGSRRMDQDEGRGPTTTGSCSITVQ